MQEDTKLQKELEVLLKNISKGLKTHSVKELNNAIIQVLNKQGTSQNEVFWILDRICMEYSMPRHVLMKSSERGEVSRARNLAYCLLHDLLGLSQRHIAVRIFNRTPMVVFKAIKYMRSLDTDVPDERELKQQFDKINKEFIEHIAKQK